MRIRVLSIICPFMKRAAWLGVIFLTAISGCTPLEEQIAQGDSAFIGYRTLCGGSVQIRHSGQLYSRIDIGAGPQTLEVVAETSPEPSAEYPSGRDYSCVYTTAQRVSFISRPRKIYRLHLLEGDNLSIGVYEALDAWAIETAPVEAKSTEISKQRRCGFFASGCDSGTGF